MLILFNKPYGVLSQFTDAVGRPTLAEYIHVPAVYAAGRLDRDSEGLLLLTDDGALIHRLTSPKKHVPKVYEIETADPPSARQIEELLRGVVLHDDPLPVRAAACERTGAHALRMTLLEGKYHQVKRMLAAAGNSVVGLHRSAFGTLALPADLAPGQWRWLAGPHDVLGPPAGAA